MSFHGKRHASILCQPPSLDLTFGKHTLLCTSCQALAAPHHGRRRSRISGLEQFARQAEEARPLARMEGSPRLAKGALEHWPPLSGICWAPSGSRWAAVAGRLTGLSCHWTPSCSSCLHLHPCAACHVSRPPRMHCCWRDDNLEAAVRSLSGHKGLNT